MPTSLEQRPWDCTFLTGRDTDWFRFQRASRVEAQFLICGTAPRSGKTMAGCALAFAFKVRGLRVGVMKPVATGCTVSGGIASADDAEALAAAASSELPSERICLFRYKTADTPLSAAISDGAPPPDYGLIADGLRAIQASSDAVIVEEAWSLDAAIDGTRDYASLAIDCGLDLIMVAARGDGFVADAVRIAEHARRRKLRWRGMILNCPAPASPAEVTRDAGRLARAVQVPLLGTVRYKEPLGLAIVRSLL
jgi:dethiobiotin synthetase